MNQGEGRKLTRCKADPEEATFDEARLLRFGQQAGSLPYVKKIVRNGRGSPIRDVLFSEQHSELWERRHVAIREADDHRCSHQSAHEQLAPHRTALEPPTNIICVWKAVR